MPVNVSMRIFQKTLILQGLLFQNFVKITEFSVTIYVNRKIITKGAKLDKFIEELLRYDRCQIGFDSCMISHLADKNALINLCSIDYCEAGRFSAFISEEGNMYPCSFMCGAGIKGYNIISEDMEDIWRNAKEFIDIRDALHSRKGKCLECDLYNLCHGGCPKFDINCR